MIGFGIFSEISDIFLTVSLIILLLIYEFGDNDIRKQFIPFIVVLLIAFFVIAFLNIYGQIK
jgi:hypothetical protein